jgi:hypothetical protein
MGDRVASRQAGSGSGVSRKNPFSAVRDGAEAKPGDKAGEFINPGSDANSKRNRPGAIPEEPFGKPVGT